MTLIKKISAVFISSVAFTSASGLVVNRFLKSENKGPAYLDWVGSQGLGGDGKCCKNNEDGDGGAMNIF